MQSRDGQAGIEGCIAAPHGDDCFVGFGNGLHVGPDMECGYETGAHLSRDGIVLEDAGLRFAIGADVVGEIAAGAKDDFDRTREICGGKDFGNHVVPGGAGACEHDGRPVEVVFICECARDFDGALEEGANGSLIVQHTLVDFDAIEGERLGPACEGLERGLELCVVANSSSAAVDAELDENVKTLFVLGEEAPEEFNLRSGVDETEELEGGVFKKARDGGHILFADELIRHENAAHAVRVGDFNLGYGGEGNGPGAGFELHLKKPRRHGGFAMGRELDTVSGDESAHPLQIVLELVLVKNGCGEAEVFAQEVPVEAWDLVVVKFAIKCAKSLIEPGNGREEIS